jgi:hypothetical protein
MQQALFEPALPPTAAPLQRWWRLQGQARQRGRTVEPLLVTPRFLARIDVDACPVTREPLAARSAVVVALRDDAAIAAGHLATLGPAAAAVPGGSWTAAWATAESLGTGSGSGQQDGLDAAAWRRLAVLRSFVQPLTPGQAATLPLLVLPPPRLRVLSPVQGLQVATTLVLRERDRAARLMRLVDAAPGEDLRLALRIYALTLVARCPAEPDRRALEELWVDPLLQRRWQRLAARLDDAGAEALLLRARRTRLLGGGWRPLDAGFAVDGWDLGGQSAHARRPAPAAPLVEGPVLGPVRRRHGADAAAAAAAGA